MFRFMISSSRGFFGKAMVVSIDKVTALRMYDKVQKYWNKEIQRIKQELQGHYTLSEEQKNELLERLQLLKCTDMALIVSPGQNEIEQMHKLGLDIEPHRRWMNDSVPGMDEKFKDPDDPLRIVFLCAMWLTGFDAPSCSTIYLDKPMRNHTLMQTIARANRVFPEKHSGLIVDISEVLGQVQEVLDESIAGMDVPERPYNLVDLSKIDFEKLHDRFKRSKHKNTDLERLKAAIRAQLEKLIQHNSTRADYLEKFEELIKSYNDGSRNIEQILEELLNFAETFSEEEQRHVREHLSEEELTIFDILTRPGPELTQDEREEVKKVAQRVLDRLKTLLGLDWRRITQARAKVKLAIEDTLDQGLPRSYTPEIYKTKCSAVFMHVYESYYGEGKGVYAKAGYEVEF